jgi:IQ calmodulin-binding motif
MLLDFRNLAMKEAAQLRRQQFQRSSAILIQTWWRDYLAKKKEKDRKYIESRAATVVRKFFAGVKDRKAYLQKRKAAVKIQVIAVNSDKLKSKPA